MNEEILQQLKFLQATDSLKAVLRKTCPIGLLRKENSAEHSWQAILAAIVLSEHSNEKIDLLTVIKMLAIHDVVEIGVGDTSHYDKDKNPNLYNQELAAAKKYFGLLPEPQGSELLTIWIEFEEKLTAESRFATAIDRLMAFIMNAGNKGGTWEEYNLSLERVLEKNSIIEDGSKALWELAQKLTKEYY